jgi:peroxiredoxin Q/BCP
MTDAPGETPSIAPQRELQIGDVVPPITLVDQRGGDVALHDLGAWAVLWWFPMAGTTGCTLEAGAFTALQDELDALGVRVLGASYDAIEDLRAFSEATGARQLLSDPDRTAGPAFGTDRLPGEPFPELPRRVSSIIDPGGRVVRRYVVTDPAGHPAEVLADLRSLIAG